MQRRTFLGRLATAALTASGAGLALPGRRHPELLVLTFADLHSAHERHAAIVAAVDGVVGAHPGIPTIITINGDLFERGNVVALRGEGCVDLALVAELRRRAPVVVNLGNHEGALFDLAETVVRLRGLGAEVVTSARDLRTGSGFAPPAVDLEAGGERVRVVGIATDDLATYRPPVRATLDIPDGPEFARRSLPGLLGGSTVRVVLSHEGVVDDRRILPLVPDGTLMMGGHDHLVLEHRAGRSLYLHDGAWGARLGVATLCVDASGPSWSHSAVPLGAGPGDPATAVRVAAAEDRYLEDADRAVVGSTRRAHGPHGAALLAAEAVRAATGADAAVLASTTFGAGLPAGPVSEHAFRAHVRFDGDLVAFEVEGSALRALLGGRANQVGELPLAARTGEYLVASGPADVLDGRRYTVATHGWVRANAARYLGFEPAFRELPGPGLRAVVAAALG